MLQACTAATTSSLQELCTSHQLFSASPLPSGDGLLDSPNRNQELVQRRKRLHVVRREVAGRLPHERSEEQGEARRRRRAVREELVKECKGGQEI